LVLLLASAAVLGSGAPATGTDSGKFVRSVVDVSDHSSSNGDPRKEAFAACPIGTVVIGGGAEVHGGEGIVLRTNSPAANDSWRAAAFDPGSKGPDWLVEAHAVCARADGAVVIQGPQGAPGDQGKPGDDGKDQECPCGD
jgi:hypothetical protein